MSNNISGKIKDLLEQNSQSQEKTIVFLADELMRNRLIVFAGAGCSIFAELPSWGDLISDIRAKFNVRTNETDLLRIASKIEKEIGSLPFREEIVSRLRKLPSSSAALHRSLVQLEVNLFITTNYDHLLEDAFRDKGITPAVIFRDKDIPTIDSTKKTIVKLHGDIDSPSSIIITSIDYHKYNSEHSSFVDWLNSKAVENTILLVGTSFTDQRLKDADDYVLKRFGDFRRPACIFLKLPIRGQNVSEENYGVELEDFEILCEEFKTRGFYVIVIEDYGKISRTLDKTNTLALQKQLQEDPADILTRLTLKTIYTEKLERDLAGLCDKRIKELCEEVWGQGQLPTQQIIREHAEELVGYLDEYQDQDALNAQSKLEGFLTLANAYLNLEKKSYVNEARKYFDKANSLYQTVEQQSKWKERLARITAKLYFFEGKIEEAIKLVSGSDDDKTISLWLALLIDSGKFDEAYRFVSTHEIKVPWLPQALYILVFTSRIDEAEKRFHKFIIDFENKKKIGNLQSTLYKNKYFYEKVCAFMADAYFGRAIRSVGSTRAVVYPQDLSNEGKDLCEKAIEYADRIFIEGYGVDKNRLRNSYFAYRASLIKMQALYFLGKFQSADETIKDIIAVVPIAREAAQYVATRVAFIEHSIVVEVLEGLLRDYSEQSWALLLIAVLQMDGLKDYDKAWKNALEVLRCSIREDEKERAAGIIFELGIHMKNPRKSRQIIGDFLPLDSLWREYLEAVYHDSIGNVDKASRSLLNIESKNPVPQLKALCKYMRALQAAKRENYQEAQRLLKESQGMHLRYRTLRKLLEIQVKLQDDIGALESTEKIEELGMSDDGVEHIKAQVARNCGYFEKSEQAWKSLAKKHPTNPELACGYADVLTLQDKHEEALVTLEPFIKCYQKVNAKCLILATDVLCVLDKGKEAFEKLDKCQSHFQDDPGLLVRHLEIGFRIGEEKRAHQSFARLEQLRQEGKIPEQAFARKNIDEIKDFIRRRQETREKLLEQYRLGKVPRLFFCSHYNIPLYLDWAYRTQELAVLPDWPARLDYTTYSTNGFRVQFVERSQLVPISVPEDAKEVAVDYSALITLHRLGLMSKLAHRFSCVYYPLVLRNIWTMDSQKYKYPQASQEKIYRGLDKKFRANLIRVIESPPSLEETHRNALERDIRLAETENIPLISAYLEKKKIPEESPVIVLRFHQVLAHLYRKGRLSETRYLELKQLVKDREDLVKEEIGQIFDNTPQLLFDESTLELAEGFDLIEPIIDSGIQIIAEKATGQSIEGKFYSIGFSGDVAQWQKDLEAEVKNIETVNKEKLFKTVPNVLRLKNERKELHYYDVLAFEGLHCAEKKELPLLTDDRFSQMIRTGYLGDRQFGSGALIRDLYARKIISLDEYARAFLKLCEWRYRFLLPEAEIIAYFAEQYRRNPLGKPLETLIKYSNECMEDQGLFLGREPTSPPSICGLKLYIGWIRVWTKALIQIWANSHLDDGNREEITNQIFLRAFPKSPERLSPEVRKNVAAKAERSIVTYLFIGTLECDEPGRFQSLFKYAFEHLGFSLGRRIDELNSYLEGVDEKTKKKEDIDDKVRTAMAMRALKAFYGEEYLRDGEGIDGKLIPVLRKLGVGISSGRVKRGELQHDSLSRTDEQRIVDYLSGRADIERRNLTEYETGPIIFIPPSEKKQGELVVLHDVIMSGSLEIREAAITKLMKENYISEHTKGVIKERLNSIVSDKPFAWPGPVREVQEALLKDFLYIQHWIRQLGDPRISDMARQESLNMAMNGALEPDIESVYSNLPLLLKDPFERDAIEARIKKEALSKGNIEEFLDWYLENVYFVPYIAKNSVYKTLRAALTNDKIRKDVTKDTSAEHILETTRRWLDGNKENHLGWLLALEIVLSTRAEIETDQTTFTDNEFYGFLDNIFKTLLLSSERDEKSNDNDIILKRLIWKFRQQFARYYLRYLDVNMRKDFNDERKIALSWWMAEKITSSFLVMRRNLSTVDKSVHMERDLDALEERFTIMRFRHQFIDMKRTFSSARYFALNAIDLLSYATARLFTVKYREGANSMLKGLRSPTPALSPEVRNIIIDKSVDDLLLGNGQLTDDSNVLRFLWNNSLCKSLPDLLEEYYREALPFLGEEIHNEVRKVKEISSLVDTVSAKIFLNTKLPLLPKNIDNDDQKGFVLVINCLKVFILSHQEGTFPNGLEVFHKDSTILKKASRFEKRLASLACSAMTQILLDLQSRGYTKWLQAFYQQFKNIDYQSCDAEVIEIIFGYLVTVVLIGGDYDVLHPLLDKKNKDKEIRELLRRAKTALESLLPYVPLGCRDNLRQILNDLSDIL